MSQGKAMPWYWASPFLFEVSGLFSGPAWLSLHLYVVTDCKANVTVLASYPQPAAGMSSQHCPGFVFDHLQNCPHLIYNKELEVLNNNFEFKWV